MVSKIWSAMPLGYGGRMIAIEGDANNGLPGFNIVGMAAKTVEESRERVRSAITNSHLTFPSKKLTINLAPAELNKDGTGFDLPIALAILTVSGQLPVLTTSDKVFVGELALDGLVRPVPGIINIVEAAREAGFSRVYLPAENLAAARLVARVELHPVRDLRSVFRLLIGTNIPPEVSENVSVNCNVKSTTAESTNNKVKLDDVCGQTQAKRALQIAVAGRHNILLSGPPGVGKTQLAKAAANLLPKLTDQEVVAVSKLHNLARHNDVVTERPFRQPHHTASTAALIGGGNKASPGEISLAHHGVLFLDEMPEYPRSSLEALRQPMEDKEITVTRVNQKLTYPADFMLIATANPCPCGYLGDPKHECTCLPQQISNYRKKLSGPLLDRIDLFVSVERPTNEELMAGIFREDRTAKEHQAASWLIERALRHQRARHPTRYNSCLSGAEAQELCQATPDAIALLQRAAERLNLSVRSYFKVLKVARTIADLDDAESILEAHVAEALQYRDKQTTLAKPLAFSRGGCYNQH